MSFSTQTFETRLQSLTGSILQDYENGRVVDRLEMFSQPDHQVICDLIEKLLRLLFPGYYLDRTYRVYHPKNHLSALVEDIAFHLNRQIALALRDSGGAPEDSAGEGTDSASGPKTSPCPHRDARSLEARAENLTADFLRQIPEIRALAETDLQAAYDGDPAATSKAEIIIAYPGFYAIVIYRLAHALFTLGVPLIPRIMTEYAHSKTGIDIHPGASIGEYFFIDHGTGIVVGETTVIGKNVKLYQGVTLGALSTRGGQRLRGRRRHPTIEDNVTIYAGASILGGDTVIGHDSVVGSNVFLTHPIPPDTRISIRNQELQYKNGRGYELQPEIPEADASWFYVI